MKKLNETYLSIISQSKIILRQIKPITRKTPTIDEVKTELLKLFKFSAWNEFIDSQQAGQCVFISKAVCRLFPKLKMVSVFVDFSKDAKEKLKDPELTYATHYLNKLNNKYLDFGKGTNCYDGVYVLDGLGNKYDVEINDEEVKMFHDEIEEDPKAIGTIIRENIKEK